MEDDEADKLDMAADLQLNSRLGMPGCDQQTGQSCCRRSQHGIGTTFRKHTENGFLLLASARGLFLPGRSSLVAREVIGIRCC